MSNQKVEIRKSNEGTTSFQAIKIDLEHLKQTYRNVTVEDLNEMKLNVIGSFKNTN